MTKKLSMLIGSLLFVICVIACVALAGCNTDDPDKDTGTGTHTHSYTAVVTPPTCTERGYTTRTCACGDFFVDNYVNAFGHTSLTAVKENEVAATCTKTGSFDEVLYCNVCNTKISTTTKTTDKVGHNYQNSVCSNCGDILYELHKFKFELSSDNGSYTIAKYNGNSEYVYIPASYEDKPVTAIGSSAFYNCTSLISVTIPDSVTSIGNYAFCGCSSLTSVTIGNGVTSIGSSAFYECNGLTSITIPDSVTSIGNYAFCGCSSLTSIIIPDSVISIGSSAFYYCSSLTSVTIGNGVTSIGESAFRSCSKLTEINYGGTKEQWNSIAKALYWNSSTGNYTVYCTDGSIKKS